MSFKIQISKELSLDIRKCAHLLIFGNGNDWSDFAKRIERQIDYVYQCEQKANEQAIFVFHCLGGCLCEREKQQLDERYELLSAFNFSNIEQFNRKFCCESLYYHVIFANLSAKKQKIDDLKQILMKGRAVGMCVIMFVDSVKVIDKDLIDMFPVKLVYKVKTEKESVLLTGGKIAKNLKKNEFVIAELGKKAVIYENNL